MLTQMIIISKSCQSWKCNGEVRPFFWNDLPKTRLQHHWRFVVSVQNQHWCKKINQIKSTLPILPQWIVKTMTEALMRCNLGNLIQVWMHIHIWTTVYNPDPVCKVFCFFLNSCPWAQVKHKIFEFHVDKTALFVIFYNL